MTGGTGVDTLNGGDGADTLIGGGSNDILNGQNGNDIIDGGVGTDTMTGGAGDDTFFVDVTTDVVNEAAAGGTDTINSTANTYTMGGQVENMNFIGTGDFVGTGNGQNNTIVGGAGNDTLNGGGGDDVLEGRGGNNNYTGAAGIDTVTYANATSGVNANLITGVATANGFGGTDNLATIENLTGSGFNDTLTGSAAANILSGGSGADTINAGGGADTVIGGAGNDTLNGEAAADIIQGGDGDDTINGGAGNDTIDGGLNNDLIIQTSTDGRDFVDGGAGTDTYQLNGVAGAETFNIYTRAAYAAIQPAVVLNANTEIVITRNGTAAANIVAELDNIEEITVNALNSTANNGNNLVAPDGGTSGGDTINVFGDFRAPATSLDYNTITINGSGATDTVNITGLESAHRIVFNTAGGNDVVIGALRPQDVVNSPDGFVGGNGISGTSTGINSGANAMIEQSGILARLGGFIPTDDMFDWRYDRFASLQDFGSPILRANYAYGLPSRFNPFVFKGDRGADRVLSTNPTEAQASVLNRDIFAFENTNTIANFSAKVDKVDVSSLGVTIDNFSDMVQLIKQGKNTLIEIADQSVLVENVTPANLKPSAFLFAESTIAATVSFTDGAANSLFPMETEVFSFADWSNGYWSPGNAAPTVVSVEVLPVRVAEIATPSADIINIPDTLGPDILGIAVDMSNYDGNYDFTQLDLPTWANILPTPSLGDWSSPASNAWSSEQLELLLPTNSLGQLPAFVPTVTEENPALLHLGMLDDFDVFDWGQDHHNGPLF
jgi:Ca2+-binding RTX toxin-like protein